MNRTKLAVLLLTCMQFVPAAHAEESQFYVYPIKLIEGLVGEKDSGVTRPLIDRNATQFLTESANQQILKTFNEQVIAAFPGSVVNARQVRNSLKGPVHLEDDDSKNCDAGTYVPIDKSYAAVMGVTRASIYTVDKGRFIEVLIPVGLNVQIVKPDKAKIIYSIGNTKYSILQFSKSEIGTDDYKSKISAKMVENINSQVAELINDVKLNFSPKSTPVKVVGKDGPFIVVDKGYEVGFKNGDMPQAGSNVFNVINADDGYSVLELIQGNIQTGQVLSFDFAVKADDSRKPRVMPVKSETQTQKSDGAIDVLTKNIGFKSPFQIVAVDANFKQTMAAIRGKTNCVDKLGGDETSQTQGDRKDIPPFLLTVETGETAHFVQTGKGGVYSKETFGTVAQAKITDLKGVVYSAGIGYDKYVLDKTGGAGLSSENSTEVSYQNSTQAMTENLLRNVKFEPKEFKIKSVDSSKGILIVEKIPAESGIEIPGVKIIRKLSVKVGAKDVFVRLPIKAGAIEQTDKETKVPYQSQDGGGPEYYKPKPGDSLITYALPKGGAKLIDLCDQEYIGKNSTITSSFAKPIISNILYNSPKYQVVDMNDALVKNIKRSFFEGYFGEVDIQRAPNKSCLQTGYLVREEAIDCAGESCKAATVNAVIVKTLEDGVPVAGKKDFVVAKKSQLQGFESTQKEGWYSVNAFDQFLLAVPELTSAINGK